MEPTEQEASSDIEPLDHSAYPEWDDNYGWALTLPPPDVRQASVRPTIARGNTLIWSCYWLTDGCGGSGHYYRDLSYALRSVGKYVADQRARS
jgi:hypothetical protein